MYQRIGPKTSHVCIYGLLKLNHFLAPILNLFTSSFICTLIIRGLRLSTRSNRIMVDFLSAHISIRNRLNLIYFPCLQSMLQPRSKMAWSEIVLKVFSNNSASIEPRFTFLSTLVHHCLKHIVTRAGHTSPT